jgi:hypothetical protein
MSAAENPILSPQGTPRPDRLLPEKTETRLPDAVAAWATWVGQTQSEIRELFALAYQRSREASSTFISEIRKGGRKMREEHPMTLLGIIAGSALAAGVAAGIWRSRRS